MTLQIITIITTISGITLAMIIMARIMIKKIENKTSIHNLNSLIEEKFNFLSESGDKSIEKTLKSIAPEILQVMQDKHSMHNECEDCINNSSKQKFFINVQTNSTFKSSSFTYKNNASSFIKSKNHRSISSRAPPTNL